jgi:hypothetical protein
MGVCAMKALRALGLMSLSLLAFVAAPQTGEAGSATEINAAANATLQSFVAQNQSARGPQGRGSFGVSLYPQSRPQIWRGIWRGGAHLKGNAAGYYNIISASFGFQLGAQSRSLIIMFMTEEALAGFQNAAGRSASMDRS